MLKIIDGFDYFPSAGVATVAQAMGWTGYTGSIYRSTNTRFGYGYSMGVASNDNNIFAYRPARGRYTAGTRTYMGMAMYVPATVGPSWYIGAIDTKTISEATQWTIQFDGLGCLTLRDGSGTIQDRSAPDSFIPGKWFYLEISTDIGTAGFFEARINTVPVLSLPAVNITGGTLIGGYPTRGWDVWYHQLSGINSGSGGGGFWVWDDFYLCDDTGSVNNTYLGNVRAQWLNPISDQTPLDWTIGGTAPAATHYGSVNNYALDDTKYVYSSTVGQRDLYGLNPILNTPGVHGIEVDGAFRQDDATQRVAHNTIQASGTDSEGVDHYTNQSYTFYSDIWETNPHTGVAFTGSEVNGLYVGPKVIV